MSIPYDCDVVVVGAGIAGMIGANVLAQKGRKVVVCEANHQAGGLMAGIWRKGFYFDVGDQSFESLGIVHRVLDEIGYLEEAGLERVVHRIRSPDFDIPCESWEVVSREVLAATVAEHRERTAGFLEDFRRSIERSAPLYTHRLNPMLEHTAWGKFTAVARFTALMLRHGLGLVRDATTRMDDLALKWGLPREISDSLTAGYRRQAVFANAGIWWAWFNDYAYPKGGLGRFFEGLVNRVEAQGGQVRFKSPVVKILVEGGRAQGVVTAKGETIRARRVLYCGDARRLYNDLLGDLAIDSPQRRKMDAAPPGDAILSVYVGLNLPVEALRERLNGGTHIFYFPEKTVHRVEDRADDPDAHARSWTLINAPILHNPGAAPAGQSSLVIQAFTDAAWLNRWTLAGRGDLARDPAYKELKRKVQQEILDRTVTVVPELRDKIVFKDIGTPQTTVRFTQNTDGSTVGWEFDPRTTPLKMPGVRTRSEVPGLFTAGQWFCWPGGVPFSVLGGHQAAHQIHRSLGNPGRGAR
ncbi:NAD(P)/FAD-dependent oxidoreductase [Myxococcota bacterium]|nr:NAD(P)/FAD-dependent oxidoreductase [Myxococcota bacterium]